MNTTQVDKLYAKLTPYEQAALAFEALARQDSVELGTIVGSVERHDYRCSHWDYRHRLTGFIDLAKYYGLIYWKTRCCMAVMDGMFKERGDEADQQAAHIYVDMVLAMETALQDLCAKANIDVMAVKKLALCEDEYSPEKCGNNELVKEYVELFIGIFGGSAVS